MILVGSILPFILNVNYSIIASFLILIIEALYGDLISKIVRDLLFDTQIKIKKNSGIFLQEKYGRPDCKLFLGIYFNR